jgi:hypothetical protein
MKGCNEIRRLIDEADQPEIFPLEVTGHIAHCDRCRGFATERSALRGLIASGKRVSAPVNFDAMLNARLAEMKGRRTPAWLNPASFMRMGAAAAGLVIAVLVIQFSGVFSTQPTQPEHKDGLAQTTPAPQPSTAPEAARPFVPPAQTEPDVASSSGPASRVTVATDTPRTSRGSFRREASPQPVPPRDYAGIEDGGVILVRGQNGEREVPLPTVSVGAQPLLYVNSSRAASRSAGTSF